MRPVWLTSRRWSKKAEKETGLQKITPHFWFKNKAKDAAAFHVAAFGGDSAAEQAEHCGWLKDKFAVSWQIVPAKMAELMGGNLEQRARVTQAFLKMKKSDIAALEAAYVGRE